MTTVFWQANATNSRGQVTQEALGNGLVTNRSYDAVTGWINSIQCAVGGGTCAQNQSYLFDLVGNMTQRQNNNLGLTENFYYDNLYRLQSSTLNSVTNLTMSYDAMGNINSKSDVAGGATWTYDGVHKHQVRQAGSPSYSYNYDSNGNAITRNGSSITWNKYNYPTVINGNGESTSLFYDGNNARWKQVYVRGATTQTTIYVGGLLEKVSSGGVDDYRHYIRAGGQLIAVMSRTSSGGNITRYLLGDSLGSVAKITDGSGASVVSESFTAFGVRRNPATWSGPPTNGDVVASNGITMAGFTVHDALGGMNLNHMNGRVQDAITGRFLSADPYITEPGNTQNYNRYSYVGNNPLSFTDPSGFTDEPNASTPVLPPVPVTCNRYPVYFDEPIYCAGGYNFYSWYFDLGSSFGTMPDTSETNNTTQEAAPAPAAPTPQTQPCTISAGSAVTPSRQNNPNLSQNVNTGAAATGLVLGTVGFLIVMNIVGFPEFEIGEGAVAVGSVFEVFAAEPFVSSFSVGGMNGLGLGVGLGSVGGYLATDPVAPPCQ